MYKKWIKKLIISVLIFTGIINLYFYIIQPSMMFYPVTEIEQVPSDWGMQFEDVRLNTVTRTVIHGWFIPANNKTSKTVLFFHGNGGNLSHRSESIYIFHKLGLNVFIIDYPGYGLSEGNPSEAGLYESAMVAWQYLVDNRGIMQNEIIIFGRSLGGAVAVDLASKTKPRLLIVESSFSSVRDVAEIIFPVLSKIIFLRYDFDSAEKAKSIEAPVLVIHSPDDDVIPFITGKKLFDAFSGEKKSLVIRGDHNTGFMQSIDSYVPFLRDYINSH